MTKKIIWNQTFRFYENVTIFSNLIENMIKNKFLVEKVHISAYIQDLLYYNLYKITCLFIYSPGNMFKDL